MPNPKEVTVATLFSVISWLVFGVIVGAIARFLVPGRQEMGWIATALTGIAGSLIGGVISWLIFGKPDETINAAGWLMSIVGAIIAVLIYARMKGARGASQF
jgi:uncharacterized membrane protein YeaQ/YmgE (transglycosylase-associated protein family)